MKDPEQDLETGLGGAVLGVTIGGTENDVDLDKVSDGFAFAEGLNALLEFLNRAAGAEEGNVHVHALDVVA